MDNTNSSSFLKILIVIYLLILTVAGQYNSQISYADFFSVFFLFYIFFNLKFLKKNFLFITVILITYTILIGLFSLITEKNTPFILFVMSIKMINFMTILTFGYLCSQLIVRTRHIYIPFITLIIFLYFVINLYLGEKTYYGYVGLPSINSPSNAGISLASVTIFGLIMFFFDNKKIPYKSITNLSILIGKFDKQLAKEYLKIAAPVLVLGAATTLTNTIDKVLLQEFTDSEQVGYYTAGFRVGGFILLISRSMSMLFFPMFSAAVAKGDFNYIRDKIFKFERFSFLFILPAVILITLYAKDIVLLLLGEQYIPSIEIMAIVTVALFLTVFNTPYGNVITGLGKFKLVAVIAIANLAVYAGILVIFLHKDILNYGSTGVAWSLLITNVLQGIFFRYYATKLTKILDNKMAFKFIGYGIVNYLISWYFFETYFVNNAGLRIFFLAIYLIITYLSFIVFKWMNKSDILQVLGLFNVKAMKNYISGEMKGKK